MEVRQRQPALDGVRAVAVVLVLLFHGGFPWMPAGYLGVSVFFTLSGFLITRLLLDEYDSRRSIDAGAFYARRVKRLLPASLLCLAAVTALGAAHRFDYAPGLRRDLLGSLFQVENWVKLVSGRSYADLTNASVGRLAPLEHYWSLAIEEQFYWVWPVVVLWLCRRWSRPGRRAAALAALAASFAAAAPVIARVWGPHAAYWATPARGGEILVGAALAGLLAWRPALPDRRAPVLWVCGPLCLAAIVLTANRWPSADGPAYRGALPLFALLSAGLILSLQARSPLRSLLGLRPVAWLGAVSYGVYLYHWPVFALVSGRDWGLDRGELFAVRAGITFALAALSYYFVEQPIRRRRPRRSGVTWRPLAAGGVGMAAVAVLAGVVVVPAVSASAHTSVAQIVPSATAPPPLSVATTTAQAQLGVAVAKSVHGPAATAAPSPTTSVATLNRPVRMLMIGDSTANATGVGLAAWAAATPSVAQVDVIWSPGCGLLRSGRVPTDGRAPYKASCDDLLDRRLPAELSAVHPDVVVVMVAMRDAEDRIWNRSEGLLAPMDARYHLREVADYSVFVDRLAGVGVAHVVFVRQPIPDLPWQGDQLKMGDPARYDAQSAVMRDVATAHPGTARVVDLRNWFDGQPDRRTMRPDGLHLSPEAATRASAEFLGPAILAVVTGGPSEPAP